MTGISRDWNRLILMETANVEFIVIIVIVEKTEAGQRGLRIREIAVKSQTLVHKILW